MKSGRDRSPLADVLARWEASGASWRVLHAEPGLARVQLCACTGEPVEVLEVTHPDDLRSLGRGDQPQ